MFHMPAWCRCCMRRFTALPLVIARWDPRTGGRADLAFSRHALDDINMVIDAVLELCRF